jgi:hypothetical protein
MRTLLSALVILASSAAYADPDSGEHDLCMHDRHCRTATNGELDELRGGFELDTRAGRLRIDIGITRAVTVNDRLVAVSHHGTPGAIAANSQFLSQLGSRAASAGATPLLVNKTPVGTAGPVMVRDNALVVQNGPGNAAPPASAFGSSAIPVIVQNTLDNQALKTFTVVNASVNSLSLMRSLRVDEMMRRATTASGR